MYETLPRERSISRDLENRRSVSDVDTDLGFLGLRSTDGFKQGEGQGTPPGSVEDEVGWEHRRPTLGVVVSDARDRSLIG